MRQKPKTWPQTPRLNSSLSHWGLPMACCLSHVESLRPQDLPQCRGSDWGYTVPLTPRNSLTWIGKCSSAAPVRSDTFSWLAYRNHNYAERGLNGHPICKTCCRPKHKPRPDSKHEGAAPSAAPPQRRAAEARRPLATSAWLQ